MSVGLRNQYDMVLTIGGKAYGYELWNDGNGQKHWGEGLAPLITPQQRITEFSYEHIPPEIDMPAAFESWSKGAGFSDFLATTATSTGFYQINSNTPKTYNYSQGVDASWDNRLYLSPAQQPDLASTGGATGPPGFYWQSNTFGLWLVSGTLMYKYDLSSTSWVLKNTAGAIVTSLAELNGIMYASLTGVAYIYSANGNVWTTYSDNQINSASIADLFVVRNGSIMAMRSEKAYLTINGQNSGTVWSSGTTIGSTSETTKSLAVVNGDYWIFKLEGIYHWDGTTVIDVWHPKYLDSSNGSSTFVWYDGLIYVVYGGRILSIDPFNTTDSPLLFVYPPENTLTNVIDEPHDSLEIKGTISQIGGTFTDLVFTVTNPAGNTYLMKGDPRTGVFHTLAYLGANANTACLAVSPGIQHASNPCIATGLGTSSIHYILPRVDLRPEDDKNCRYTSTGTIYGPWFSYGARAFNKFLNRGTVLTAFATAGNNVTLSYQLDDNTLVTTQVVNGINVGINQANISSTVSFYRMRYVITLNSQDTGTTPVMTGATLHSTLNPPRRRIWKPLVSLKPNQLLRDAASDTQDVSTLRSALYTAASSRITMTDRENNSYTVRILDIQETQLTFSTEGSAETDNQVLQITLAEIAPLTSNLPPAKYGQARYNQGYIYS